MNKLTYFFFHYLHKVFDKVPYVKILMKKIHNPNSRGRVVSWIRLEDFKIAREDKN